MKITAAMGLVATVLLGGCLSTRAPETVDGGRYRLVADTLVDANCEMFTSLHGLWFGGLDQVQCLAGLVGEPPRDPLAGTRPAADRPPLAVLRKSSLVRVARVFTINAVDATSSNAELLVTEPGSREVRHVYSQNWPFDRDRYLAGEAAP